MKFTVDAGLFSSAIQAVKGASGQGQTLHLVKLEAAKDGTIALSANDNNIQSTRFLDAQITEPGECCLNVDDLSTIARHLSKKGEVLVETDEEHLDLTFGRSQFRFSLLNSDLFIPWDEEITQGESIDSDQLTYALNSVIHAVAADDNIPQLAGILIKQDPNQENRITAAATDGNRLAINESSLEFNLPENGIIIPTRAVREILRSLQGAGLVTIAVNDRILKIETSAEILLTKLIDGTYPNYQAILNQDFSYELDLKRKDFLEGVNRIGSILTRKPILKLSIDTQGVHLKATRDQASAVETVFDEEIESELEIEFGLNVKYLSDALKSSNSDIITISYSSPEHPIKVIGQKDNSLIQVMMPARI